MTKEVFVKMVESLKKASDRSYDLYKNYNIDLIDYDDIYADIISSLGKEVFTPEGWDWVEYFVYEDGHKVTEGDVEIPFSTAEEVFEALKNWGYVKE